MKTSICFLLAGVFYLPILCNSFEATEDEVLPATFIAFQAPGILSQEYIDEQQTVLEMAAKDGNSIARLVVNKSADRAGKQGPAKDYLMTRAEYRR